MPRYYILCMFCLSVWFLDIDRTFLVFTSVSTTVSIASLRIFICLNLRWVGFTDVFKNGEQQWVFSEDCGSFLFFNLHWGAGAFTPSNFGGADEYGFPLVSRRILHSVFPNLFRWIGRIFYRRIFPLSGVQVLLSSSLGIIWLVSLVISCCLSVCVA